jgi:hypothetical protein
MPYYVYRRSLPIGILTPLGEHATYRDARTQLRTLRGAGSAAGEQFRLIHADSALQAEDLLSQVREGGPQPGDD